MFDCCGQEMIPICFEDKEFKDGHFTGRVRIAIDYLLCEICGERLTTDGSLDGEWRFK